MVIQLLTLFFHLPGCRSLKEKRSRLGGLKDKFGRVTNVAITESDFHDLHQQAEWSVIIMAKDQSTVDRIIAQLELTIDQLDVLLIKITRERL
ncbi:DUF503 domain-containing protein [Endozoicomonas sp. SM1973]|uniref:DUF503 domain-containing protein n=1 Tax=Spartinivicinus marinus TaxID=2994442 RepID=A0A853HWC4_9GAMM|nr:DUF503 domain-containing protein [Spartinivicinus marinus]MCX4028864.1 DUF503 domain-containing protein [Spartinivicinus marinus]NYZ65553.1 DUF503 domain-containing protein [Spartinivicinus marinus]